MQPPSFLLLGLSFWIVGCAAHQPFTYRKYQTAAASNVLTFNYSDPTADSYFKTRYENAGSDRREIRNRILFELMGMVDDYYYEKTIELRSQVIGKNLVTELTGIGTSFASALAGGEQIKTVLAAISTGIQTFNASVDKEIFLDQTIQAIRFQMDGNRSKIKAEILRKMAADSSAFPIKAGLQDIIAYYDAGTVTSALATLAAEAAANKTTQSVKAEVAANTLAGIEKTNARINSSTDEL